MPAINTDMSQMTKRQKRESFDRILWKVIVEAAKFRLDSNVTDSETAIHVLAQYLKGTNPGAPVADLKAHVANELALDWQEEQEEEEAA